MQQHYRQRGLWVLVWWLVSGLWLTAQATHIVGGEFELLHQLNSRNSSTHRLNLNLYFDDINGNPSAEDATVTVGIFSKRTNNLVGTAVLPRVSTELVDYTNSACTVSSLRTRLIRYGVDVTLNTATFNDPGGYYVSWERCCRNNAITNITGPGQAGSAFYLEFPAVVNGTTAFINSSPVFGKAKGDYICLNTPFSFDFGAKDADGDSLTYALVTPYNGFSGSGNANPAQPNGTTTPTFTPGPYPLVRWNTGIDITNQIPGTAPLRVNGRTGLLTVTANRAGLFVFSVEVDEFRRGVRIGRVRRDFQLQVIDCPRNSPPALLLRSDGQRNFYREGTVLTIAEKDTNCLTLYVTDADINQRVSILNQSGALPGLSIAPNVLVTRTSRDTLQAKFCFGRCVGRADGQPITLAIVAQDDGCPQGRADTLYVSLNIVGDPNNKPAASTNLTRNTGRVSIGSSLSFTAFGVDVNDDNITLTAVGRGFALPAANMTFGNSTGKGRTSSVFRWQPACVQQQREYIVDFIVADNRCSAPLRDTVTVRLTADALPSLPPTVATTLTNPVIRLTMPPAGDSDPTIRFDVLGDDRDRDIIKLTGRARGFDFRTLGINFADKTGTPIQRSPLVWTPTCELLAGKDSATFVLDFIVNDGSCQPKNADTTTVRVTLTSLPIEASLRMPNVFTPNGDGKNDVFMATTLPTDNCAEAFRYVEIENRWGREVFYSTDRAFRWDAATFPPGEYFYHLRFTTQSVKGVVTLLK
jgi:gliding motility-associated-like protein